MKYCKKCLTTDLRPNAAFVDGVCIACLYSETDQNLYQNLKLKLLIEEFAKLAKSSEI